MSRLTKKIPEYENAVCICCINDDSDCGNCGKFTQAINKLAEFEDAEEQGRLHIFPCEVGDTVYTLEELDCFDCKYHIKDAPISFKCEYCTHDYTNCPKQIVEKEVIGFDYYGKEICLIKEYGYDGPEHIAEPHFSKSEAEKALGSETV